MDGKPSSSLVPASYDFGEANRADAVTQTGVLGILLLESLAGRERILT